VYRSCRMALWASTGVAGRLNVTESKRKAHDKPLRQTSFRLEPRSVPICLSAYHRNRVYLDEQAGGQGCGDATRNKDMGNRLSRHVRLYGTVSKASSGCTRSTRIRIHSPVGPEGHPPRRARQAAFRLLLRMLRRHWRSALSRRLDTVKPSPGKSRKGRAYQSLMTSAPFAGRAGKGLCGSIWYQ